MTTGCATTPSPAAIPHDEPATRRDEAEVAEAWVPARAIPLPSDLDATGCQDVRRREPTPTQICRTTWNSSGLLTERLIVVVSSDDPPLRAFLLAESFLNSPSCPTELEDLSIDDLSVADLDGDGDAEITFTLTSSEGPPPDGFEDWCEASAAGHEAPVTGRTQVRFAWRDGELVELWRRDLTTN